MATPETFNGVDAVVDAIEAFMDAKIGHAKQYAHDPEWASTGEVDAARENLERKLTLWRS